MATGGKEKSWKISKKSNIFPHSSQRRFTWEEIRSAASSRSRRTSGGLGGADAAGRGGGARCSELKRYCVGAKWCNEGMMWEICDWCMIVELIRWENYKRWKPFFDDLIARIGGWKVGILLNRSRIAANIRSSIDWSDNFVSASFWEIVFGEWSSTIVLYHCDHI